MAGKAANKLLAKLTQDELKGMLRVWEDHALDAVAHCDAKITSWMADKQGIISTKPSWRFVRLRLLKIHRQNPNHSLVSAFKEELSRLSTLDVERKMRGAHRPPVKLDNQKKLEARKERKKRRRQEKKRELRNERLRYPEPEQWTSSAITNLLQIWLKYLESGRVVNNDLDMCVQELMCVLHGQQVFISRPDAQPSQTEIRSQMVALFKDEHPEETRERMDAEQQALLARVKSLTQLSAMTK